MNNDFGIATVQTEGEGTALPPPRVIGDMTTLTLSRALAGGGEASSFMATEVVPTKCSGQRAALRAAIVAVAADAITITF